MTGRGRGWAYAGAVLGAVVSVSANVAHSFVPPAGAPAGWAPKPGAVAGSVFWPLAVLVALEILARVDWPGGRRWIAVRWLGIVPLGIVAGVISYRHLAGLLAWYGEDAVTAAIGPLAVDGLMLLASAALLTGHRAEAAPAVTATVVASQPLDVEARPSPVAVTVPVVSEDAAGVLGDGQAPTGESATPPSPEVASPVIEAPVAAPAPVRRAPARRKPVAAASDDDLLGLVDAAVERGDLDAAAVTPSRLRSLLGVGAGRAARLAEAWHDQHRHATVTPLRTATAGD